MDICIVYPSRQDLIGWQKHSEIVKTQVFMSNILKKRQRLPTWLKAKAPGNPNYVEIKRLVADKRLHTVCESAHCPNIGECWGQRTATFMILGDICTRSCGFCAIKTGRPEWLDEDEPQRVAEAVAHLNLRHAVITSVNRDELPDGGAGIFARTLEASERCPQTTIEVLYLICVGMPSRRFCRHSPTY